MPFMYPFPVLEKSKKFTLQECKGLGLKFWQCPPFQFALVAIVLLVGVLVIASRFILDVKTALIILFVFAGLMVISAYIIVRKYRSRF